MFSVHQIMSIYTIHIFACISTKFYYFINSKYFFRAFFKLNRFMLIVKLNVALWFIEKNVHVKIKFAEYEMKSHKMALSQTNLFKG